MKKYMFLKWMLFSLYAAQAQPGNQDGFDFSLSKDPKSTEADSEEVSPSLSGAKNDGRIQDQVLQDQALAQSLQKEEEKKRVQEERDYILVQSLLKEKESRQEVEQVIQKNRAYVEDNNGWLKTLIFICNISPNSSEEASNKFKILLELMGERKILDKGVSPIADKIFIILFKKYSKDHIFDVMKTFFDHGLMLSNDCFHNFYYEICGQGDLEKVQLLYSVLRLNNPCLKNKNKNRKDIIGNSDRMKIIENNINLYLDAVMRGLEETAIKSNKDDHNRYKELIKFLFSTHKKKILKVSDAILKSALKNNNLEALQFFYHKGLHKNSDSNDLFLKNYEALCNKAQKWEEVISEIHIMEALNPKTKEDEAKIRELHQKKGYLFFTIVQSMDTIPFLLKYYPNLSERDQVFKNMFDNEIIYLLRDLTIDFESKQSLKKDISTFFKPSPEALQGILDTLRSKDSLDKKEKEMLDYLESESFQRESGIIKAPKAMEEERKE